MTSKTVLIVDDDPEILRQIGAALASAGYDVHTAADGAIGLKRFNAVTPDVVVIDIIMPHREGLETIMAMRQARAATKIVAMSGGGRIGPHDFLNLARHIGADAVIAKPFRLAEIVALVDGALEGSAREPPAVDAA